MSDTANARADAIASVSARRATPLADQVNAALRLAETVDAWMPELNRNSTSWARVIEAHEAYCRARNVAEAK